MKNYIRIRFESEPNIFLAICIIAMAVDSMRVLPLALVDLSLNQDDANLHLFLGPADFILIAFFLLATPKIEALLAITCGVVTGISLRAVGFPAVSGWIFISVPWILSNRKHFHLSRKERVQLLLATLFISLWMIPVFTGHVVDPAMQGKDSVGWIYGAQASPKELHHGLLIQFEKNGQSFIRRIHAIEGDELVLWSDNKYFGEDYRELRIKKGDVRGEVCWLFHPSRLLSKDWIRKTIHIGHNAKRITLNNPKLTMYYNQGADVWIVATDSWSIVQSGDGVPIVFDKLLASVSSDHVRIYGEDMQIVEDVHVAESEIFDSAIVAFSASRRDVIVIDSGGLRNTGETKLGESINEAAARLEIY